MAKGNSDEPATLLEHLLEIRNYVFLILGALIVGGGVTHYFHRQIIAAVFSPLGSQHLIFLSPLDPLLFIFKVDFYGGILLALPFFLFAVFRFVAPALGARASRYVAIFCLFSTLLALTAAVYTYVFLIPITTKFLLSIQVPGVSNFFTADKYLGFVFMQMALMIGIFQIPCVILLLSAARIFNPSILSKNRPIAYVVMIIGLSILTPTTDLYSLSLFLIPTLIIYELSVGLGKAVYYIRTKNKEKVEKIYSYDGQTTDS